jgi:hypothetical protein
MRAAVLIKFRINGTWKDARARTRLTRDHNTTTAAVPQTLSLKIRRRSTLSLLCYYYFKIQPMGRLF